MEEERGFSPWQIQRLRLRLKAYKTHLDKGWAGVAEDIILSSSNMLDFPELSEDEERRIDDAYRDGIKRIRPDVGWPIQAQDLLRFADGEQNKKTGIREFRKTSPEKVTHVYNFLLVEDYLPQNFKEIDWTSWDRNMLISLSEKFSVSSSTHQVLNGFYKHQRDEEVRLLEFVIPPNSSIYEIVNTVQLFSSKTDSSKNQKDGAGWAVSIGGNSLLTFTASCERWKKPDLDPDVNCVYSFDVENGSVTTLSIGQLNQDDPKPSAANNLLIFNRLSGPVCEVESQNAKVINIQKKQENKHITGKPKSFGQGGSAAEKWKHFQQSSNQEKGSSMSDDLGPKFVDAADCGNAEEVREILDTGFDVNHRDPETQAHALHIVASGNCMLALRELEKSEDLEYLVIDGKGNLPSYYAMVSVNQPELAQYLIEKECAEAKAKGIDYLNVQNMDGPA